MPTGTTLLMLLATLFDVEHTLLVRGEAIAVKSEIKDNRG